MTLTVTCDTVDYMTITQQVESILKHDRWSRNSDKRLLVVYLQKAGMQLTDRQIDLFMELPSMETLRRTRQALQMQGKYPADPEIEQHRFNKYKQVKQKIQNESPEELLEAQGKRVVEWGQGK